MRITKSFLLLCVVLLTASFSSLHKYYVSVTEVNFVKSERSLQIITRLFIDDIEQLLQEKYNKNLVLNDNLEPDTTQTHIGNYLKQNFTVALNNRPVNFIFLGKDYDNNIMRCYLEIKNIDSVNSISITNKVLIDLFSNQKNIIKLNINSNQKSYLLNSKQDSFSHHYSKN